MAWKGTGLFFSWMSGDGNTWGELWLAIVTRTEPKYHRRRRQDRSGRLTPIEYEGRTTSETGRAAGTRHLTKTCTRLSVKDYAR